MDEHPSPPGAPEDPRELMLASRAALAYVRQVLDLTPAEPLTLDLLCQRGFFGTEEDKDAILARVKGSPDVTLQEIRQHIMALEALRDKMLTRAAVASRREPTFEEAAKKILELCTFEVRTEWIKVAQEMSDLPEAELIAACVNTNYTALGASDFESLRPRSETAPVRGIEPPPISSLRGLQTCPAEVSFSESAGLFTVTERFPLCGKAFVPTRTGARFGCVACGEHHHELQKWTIKKVQAQDRNAGPFTDRLPVFDATACTCGQLVAAGSVA